MTTLILTSPCCRLWHRRYQGAGHSILLVCTLAIVGCGSDSGSTPEQSESPRDASAGHSDGAMDAGTKPKDTDTGIRTRDADRGVQRDANAGPKVDPATCRLWDGDEDGLGEDVERDAGLDPCKADTDDDGCSDPAELLLGGCDDPRNAIALGMCYEGNALPARVQFRAPARDGGAWSKLTLSAAPGRDVEISALASSQGDMSTSGASFLSVTPGALLSFEIVVSSSSLVTGMITLHLTAADGAVLDQGKILVVVPECPILI